MRTPAGTPAAVVERLNQAAREALASPEVQSRLGRIGVQVQPGSPAELQALLAGEIRRWGEVIRAARIEPQ